MKKTLVALSAFLLFACGNENKTSTLPACCTDKCSKECIEVCQKNNCTEVDCCDGHSETACQGHACKKASAEEAKNELCCASLEQCKEKCAKGECAENCKVEGEETACCVKE